MQLINLSQRLKENGMLQPNREAIVYNDKRISYQELDQLVDRFANGLISLGVKPGDKMLISLSNCPEFIIAYYAALRMKVVVVPVNPSYTTGELAVIMNDCQPSVVVTAEASLNTFNNLNLTTNPRFIAINAASGNDRYFSFDGLMESSDAAAIDIQNDQKDIAVLLYTSGTTGAPKGAMLTSKNLYSNAVAITEVLEITSDNKIFLVAPVYHAAAQSVCMNTAINCGATLVIHNRFLGPQILLETIEKEKVTFLFGPPIFYVLLCNYTDYYQHNFESLRYVISGAAALPESVFNKFKDIYGIEIIEGYGLSEASPVVSVNPYRGTKKVGSIGLPLPDVQVKIVDDDFNELPTGQIGELAAKGPNIMKGYYQKETETKQVLLNGWLRTGDMAYIDQDGYIFLVDRKKDLIIRGGMNIYPREIEEVLHTHPDVLEAAVVGIPDELKGEELKAFIVTRSGNEISIREIKELLKDKVASFKIPKHFVFVPELPKNSSGKILKRELQKTP
ncbi:long-chain fatty acid--CoA ligase [Peptococcaceae bacterium 1198_IL3148]